MASADPTYESKLQELSNKVAELEDLSAALRELIKPGFDVRTFHTVYDPLMETARETHDVFHELLQTIGVGHGAQPRTGHQRSTLGESHWDHYHRHGPTGLASSTSLMVTGVGGATALMGPRSPVATTGTPPPNC
jgi:hypothetical protein